MGTDAHEDDCLFCDTQECTPDGACPTCARAIARYVLEQPSEVVIRFWNVDGTFLTRRAYFQARSALRRGAEGEIYAGLAVGYLEVGLSTEPVLAAALSIQESDVLEDICCRSPVAVLLAYQLLRSEPAGELRPRLGHWRCQSLEATMKSELSGWD